jgi:hypothetical protein
VDAVQMLKAALNNSHVWFDGTCADVSMEQANFVPAGIAHPIGELAAHVIQSEDWFINGMLQGQPTIWERDGWGDKLGMPNVVRQTLEVAKGFRGDVAALQPYKEAVYKNSEAYLGSLKPADLDRELDFMGSKMPLGELFSMLIIGNTFAHTGEISALKGIQGARGYPF